MRELGIKDKLLFHLEMNNLYLAKIEMARDITEEDPNEDVQTNIVQATLYIEKIILLSNKKIGQDEISYIQVTFQKSLPTFTSIFKGQSQ